MASDTKLQYSACSHVRIQGNEIWIVEVCSRHFSLERSAEACWRTGAWKHQPFAKLWFMLHRPSLQPTKLVMLCPHDLLPFVLNGYSFTCSATVLRPFLFVLTQQFFKTARAALPPPARGCSINAYKTLYLLQYIILFYTAILVKCSCTPVVKCSCAQVVKSGCAVVKMVKAWSNLITRRVPF